MEISKIGAELLKFFWEIDVILLFIIFGSIQQIDMNPYFEFASMIALIAYTECGLYYWIRNKGKYRYRTKNRV